MGDLTVFLLHFHRRQVAEPNPSIHAGLRFKVGRFYDQGVAFYEKLKK